MRQSTGMGWKRFMRCLMALVILSVFWSMGHGPSVPEARAGQLLKVGLLQEPKTLNFWLASDRWSSRVLSLMYQRLYIRDPKTLELIPWLAEGMPQYDEATLTYTVKLKPAKWSDGSEFTAEDVAFTGNTIKEFKVPRYRSRWKFIKSIETPDKHTVRFCLEEPMAVFTSRTLTTPIVPKKEWGAIVEEARKTEKPLTTLLNHRVEKPLASGPFVLKQWKDGAFLFLEKNKHFFGTGKTLCGRTLGPFIDGMIFKFFGTSDAAILALKKGSIDMFWWRIEAGYIEDLQREKDIQLFYNERSALYYMGFNLRRPPFDDPNLRRAVAILIDKDFILKRIVQGYGVKMRSVVPSGNKFWYCDEVPVYGEGLSRKERVKQAYDMLKQAGYTWEVAPVEEDGKVTDGKGIKLPGGQTMPDINILTPPADYDPLRAMSGMIIQEWLRAVGIHVSARPMSLSSLLQQVKSTHDFDAFILAYGRLDIDPDWMRRFFHSSEDRKRGSNKSGYKNPEFDRIAEASARAMDRNERRNLVRDMQKLVIQDVPYVPLYNPKLVEAARMDQFSGWVEMLEGIGNLWSFCVLKGK